MNKYGTYIQMLMTTIVDKDQTEFVTNLSWYELTKISDGIQEFLNEHRKDDSDERKQTERLLEKQEENNGEDTKREDS